MPDGPRWSSRLILGATHHQEAPLQAFHHVVGEDVRDPDDAYEQDHRLQLARTARSRGSARRVRDARSCRTNERHCGHHQLPHHIRLIVKKKLLER